VFVLNKGETLASGSPAELMSALDQKAELHITLEEGADKNLCQNLKRLEFVRELNVQNKTLTITIDTPASVPDLVQAIVQNGGRVCSVIPKELSLEDVYFSLQDRSAESN